MRERAAAVGGELRVGAANGGGFAVEAVLPVAVEAAA
jgi:signal transduction histidine kinase